TCTRRECKHGLAAMVHFKFVEHECVARARRTAVARPAQVDLAAAARARADGLPRLIPERRLKDLAAPHQANPSFGGTVNRTDGAAFAAAAEDDLARVGILRPRGEIKEGEDVAVDVDALQVNAALAVFGREQPAEVHRGLEIARDALRPDDRLRSLRAGLGRADEELLAVEHEIGLAGVRRLVEGHGPTAVV